MPGIATCVWTMTLRTLTTVDEVLDACGGTSASARLTSRKPQHVSNWRAEQRIARDTFLIFQDALAEKKLTAPPSLWGISSPAAPPKKTKKRRRSITA